jgi:hypothetical protein
MHNRQAITFSRLWTALSDYDLWPIYLLGLLVYTPMVPIRTYITLTLKGVGFDTVHPLFPLHPHKNKTNNRTQFVTNLLIIPYNITHILMLNGLTHLSERLNERSLVSMLQPLWVLPCIITLRLWSGAMIDAWGTYSIMTVLLSYPYAHAILVGWTSKNSNNVGTRTVSAAVYNSTLPFQPFPFLVC